MLMVLIDQSQEMSEELFVSKMILCALLLILCILLAKVLFSPTVQILGRVFKKRSYQCQVDVVQFLFSHKLLESSQYVKP